MPSKTPKQARFMRAVAHGWKPSRVKAPPVSVAKEFVEADKKYAGGFAENRYWRGGLAAMDDVNAGYKGSLNNPFQWQEGGEVDYRVGPGEYEAPTVEEMGPAMRQMLSDMEDIQKSREEEWIDYTWEKTTSDPEAKTDIDDTLAEMSGPEQVEYVKPRLLSAMRKMKIIGESPKFKDYSIADYMDATHQVHLWRSKWTQALQQQAKEAEGEEKEMQRGGRVIRLDPGFRGGIQQAALADQGYEYDPNTYSMYAPEPTIAAADAAETPTYDPYYGTGGGGYPNAWGLPPGYLSGIRDPANYVRDPDSGGYRFVPPEDGPGPGGGPGGPGTAPPRIIPTDPASYVGASSDTSGRESEYRTDLRKHQRRIKKLLGVDSARGGHVNYYQEGGLARPGHAEGPNPYPPDSARYRLWERENHIDPPPPPEPEAAAPQEDLSWWQKLLQSGETNVTRTEKALEEMGEARGGRVGYQMGGLATAAAPTGRMTPPAGGIPPWLEPMGSGPGYGDEEQGYQFGGFASRFAPAARATVGRGSPRGGGFLSRLRGFRPQQPGGALQRAMMQMRQQRGGAGGLPPGIDPRAVAANPQGYARWAADPRSAAARGAPGGAMGRTPVGMQLPPFRRTPTGEIDLGGGRTPEWGPDMPGGSGPFVPRMPERGTPIGGTIPPWKQLPGQRRQVPPSPGRAYPGGPGGPMPGGEQLPMGGARVPPNMRGYLQKMRMMNRPPANVGGAQAQRVGMGDQQGALARAMQRGAGRAPMSRRMGFGRGAQR